MAKKTSARTHAGVRELALSYPGVADTPSCVNMAFKVGKKNFVFLGEKDDGFHVRLKLKDSLDEAWALADEDPDTYVPSKMGWVHVKFPTGKKAPAGLLDRWIDESYRLFATKKLIAELDS